MLATGLIAVDSTIIATAVPSIVRDIGGFPQFPWLFSIYLLAQAVSVPVYGKLADLFGRKPVILFGIGLFLLGSVLCGAAWSMGALIGSRALQGLGAGAIAPVAITIVGDIYSPAERAKAQGYIASVWGIAAVVGPTLGGLLSEYASWRWIFFVNIPLCLLSAAMLGRHFHEQVERSRPRIDSRGATLLTGGLALVILGVLEGGQAWAWHSPQSIAIFSAGALLLVGFGMVERTAIEPVLPLWVFRRRLLVASSLIAAGVAGIALATLSMGWPISASQAGKVYLRIGFRNCALIGTSITVVGTALLLLFGEHTSVWQVAATCLVIGAGMGLTVSPTLISAQSSVGWRERGVVTANNLFLRSVGSSLGIAGFGALANAVVGRAGGQVDPVALTSAVRHIFAAVVVIAVLMLATALALPRQPLPEPG